jgi:short-subunit dehydrogenase
VSRAAELAALVLVGRTIDRLAALAQRVAQKILRADA